MEIDNSAVSLGLSVDTLCGRVAALQERFPRSTRRRILIALAGVPGSGKSTVATALTISLREQGAENVVVLPMVLPQQMNLPQRPSYEPQANSRDEDGYHFPKSVLSAFEDPEEAFRRRGAPFTFDADAFVKLAMALRTSPVTALDEPQLAVRVPSFDHSIQDPVYNDICVSSSDRIVILEGNYLLLDEEPWNVIAKMVDERWFVNIPAETAKQRLIERHLRAGIEHTREAAAARAEENDLRNGNLIRAKLIKPDIWIEN